MHFHVIIKVVIKFVNSHSLRLEVRLKTYLHSITIHDMKNAV